MFKWFKKKKEENKRQSGVIDSPGRNASDFDPMIYGSSIYDQAPPKHYDTAHNDSHHSYDGGTSYDGDGGGCDSGSCGGCD